MTIQSISLPILAFIQELGFSEIVILAGIAFFILWPFWRIFKKAGYPGPFALLVLVPVVNLIAIWFLAFANWPSLQKSNQE